MKLLISLYLPLCAGLTAWCHSHEGIKIVSHSSTNVDVSPTIDWALLK